MPHDSTGGPDGSKEVLFRAFRRSRSRRIRNELVERHLHLVDYHVRRYASRGVAAEDVRQVASIALVLAVERFDPDVGVAFSTFASRTIDGECKRYLRDRTWGVRPPRRMQEADRTFAEQASIETQAVFAEPKRKSR